MKNNYEIVGNTVEVHLIYDRDKVVKTIIDLEDFDLVNSYPGTYHPYLCRHTKSYYAVGNKHNGASFRMHRLIMNPEDTRVVDHVNHDTVDNRRCNLRILENYENLQNRRGATRASKSGIRGVCWDKRRNKWKVQIYKKNKLIFYSHHDDIGEAEKKATEMRSKLLLYA